MRRSYAAVGVIAAKDLRQRFRDKSFFMLGILTPLVLAFVLNLVFGGGDELELRIGVQDADRSPMSTSLTGGITELDGEGGIRITELDAGADPDAVIDRDGLDAVIVVPAGFGELASRTTSKGGAAVEAATSPGATPQLRVVQHPDRPILAGVARSVADAAVSRFERSRLLTAAGNQLGLNPDPTRPVEDVELVRESPGGDGLNPAARVTAGMAIMFVFFTVLFGVTTLLSERSDGTLTRLLAAPISRDAVIAAKGLVSFVLGVLATMLLLVVATLLMDASWGPWLGVFALVVTAVLTAVAIMTMVAGLARSADSAGSIQSIIAVGLAMLGGSWFPISGDGVIGTLSRLTPHYWFLTGLERLSATGSFTAVLAPVGAMAVIAVLFGIPATVLVRRRLAP